MKVKLNIQQENNIQKRKKKDIFTDEIKGELSFDDFPEISEPINEPKKKKISDEFHEKVKIEQFENEKLIIQTLPELMTDDIKELNLKNEDPKSKRRINDSFQERIKNKRKEDEKIIIQPIQVTSEEKLDVSKSVEDENLILENYSGLIKDIFLFNISLLESFWIPDSSVPISSEVSGRTSCTTYIMLS